MKKLLFLSLSALLMLTAHASVAAPSPSNAEINEILKKADEVRNPSDSYYIKVEVHNSDNDKEVHVFSVAIEGNNKTLIETLEPARDRGRNLLMVDEAMWAYVPNLKREIRVSLNQKLTGKAANGDISRMRWAGDYDARIESETATEWVLYLSATKKSLTYERLRLWIQKSNYHPIKTEFLSETGKILKKATYQEYKTLEGAERPTEIVIVEASKENQRSTIKIVEMKVKKFTPAIFNRTELGTQRLTEK